VQNKIVQGTGYAVRIKGFVQNGIVRKHARLNRGGEGMNTRIWNYKRFSDKRLPDKMEAGKTPKQRY